MVCGCVDVVGFVFAAPRLLLEKTPTLLYGSEKRVGALHPAFVLKERLSRQQHVLDS
jgi:hypothetical protein